MSISNKYSSWLLSNLWHCLDDDNPKTQPYLDFIATTKYGSELLQKQRDRKLERELEATTDLEFIKEKAATQNPKLLKAIARNNCTPIELLAELSTIKDTKYVRKIRINALETLQRKNKYKPRNFI